MNVSLTLLSLKQTIQNSIFGDFSCMKHNMWCMYNSIILFLTCYTNTRNQGHNIGPLNLYKLQKIHSQLRRTTTVSLKIRIQTSTEKNMKSFIHTSANTYKNREKFLFKKIIPLKKHSTETILTLLKQTHMNKLDNIPGTLVSLFTYVYPTLLIASISCHPPSLW